MIKYFKTILAAAVLSTAVFCGYTGTANAASNDYCREYTRTVTIGNRVQDAYGTACRQPDGSWMIVGEGLSSDIPDNASNVDYVIADNGRSYSPSQVVYYDTYPDVRYARVPSPVLVWNHDGHYRGRTYYSYSRPVYYSPRPRNNYNFHNRYDRYDRYDRHDRYDRDNRPSNRNDNSGNGRWERNGNRNGYDPRDSQIIRRSRD